MRDRVKVCLRLSLVYVVIDFARKQLRSTAFAVAFLTISTVPKPAQALTTTLSALELVMTGSSSSGNDQVWLRVVGQPAGVANDCVYGSWSLLYADGTNGISTEKVLSILLTAKTTNRAVLIEYGLAANASDFFGYGISKCHIMRIALM